MKQQLLVTAIGKDRPGIVARITEVFKQHDANLEESRMAILGGEFAAIMLITLTPDQKAPLAQSLKKLASESITVSTKDTQALEPDKFRNYSTCEIVVTGADHEGIVHSVTSHLHDNAINIQSLETGVTPAPETGIPLFNMKATVLVPPTMQINELERRLSTIGDTESVDITVRERVATGARS